MWPKTPGGVLQGSEAFGLITLLRKSETDLDYIRERPCQSGTDEVAEADPDHVLQ